MKELQEKPEPVELRCLQAVVEHGTVAAAAGATGLTICAVDAHLDRLRERSGCHKIHQIVAWAYDHDYLKKGSDRKQT